MPLADRRFHARITAALACLMLGGCADTLERRDFITAHSGDAHAANKAIHIVDPWKRESFDTRIRADGARYATPVTRYRNAESGAVSAPAPAAATR